LDHVHLHHPSRSAASFINKHHVSLGTYLYTGIVHYLLLSNESEFEFSALQEHALGELIFQEAFDCGKGNTP
jgi:hypothetical protein